MSEPDPNWTGLLQRVVDGDALAFVQASRLVNSFLVRWNAYVFRDEWDDLVQEGIARGVLALGEGRLRDPQAAIAFLKSTARFKFVDRVRIQLRAGSGENFPWEAILVGRERPLEEQLAAVAREDLLGRPDREIGVSERGVDRGELSGIALHARRRERLGKRALRVQRLLRVVQLHQRADSPVCRPRGRGSLRRPGPRDHRVFETAAAGELRGASGRVLRGLGIRHGAAA